MFSLDILGRLRIGAIVIVLGAVFGRVCGAMQSEALQGGGAWNGLGGVG